MSCNARLLCWDRCVTSPKKAGKETTCPLAWQNLFCPNTTLDQFGLHQIFTWETGRASCCQWRQCRQVATDKSYIFTDVICDKRRANFELCSQYEGRIYTNQNVFLCWSDFRKLFYYNVLRVKTTLPYKEGYSQEWTENVKLLTWRCLKSAWFVICRFAKKSDL